MPEIKKILIPIDFSEAAANAVTYAGHFCKEDAEREVTLLHVSEAKMSEKEKITLNARLHDFYHRFSSLSKASCKAEFYEGQPLTETIIKYQADHGQDLIIMGTKGSDEAEEVAQSNTSSVVLEADCPVIAVPVKYQNFALNNIALALGRNEIDDSFALGVLHNIARSFDAKVHILTISKPEEASSVIQDSNEGVLEYYLETIDFRHSFPTNTDIEEGITHYVREKNIDLLVILPRNHATKSTPSEGRLTKLLTLHAEVPVLSID